MMTEEDRDRIWQEHHDAEMKQRRSWEPDSRREDWPLVGVLLIVVVVFSAVGIVAAVLS